MIDAATGTVTFSGGLVLRPLDPLRLVAGQVVSSRALPVTDWKLHDFASQTSEFGHFDVCIASGPDECVRVIMLTHRHDFYEAGTAADGERRVFHQGILERDLQGRRDFPWGGAFCRFDESDHRDRLIVAYTGGSPASHEITEVILNLEEYERAEQRRD